MPEYTAVFTEPNTNVVMLRTPIVAGSVEAAVRAARKFQSTRSSIMHWMVSVEAPPKAAPNHPALGPRRSY